MTNNLLFLKCNVCHDDFCIAKYYPSVGWHYHKDTDQYNNWLEKHKECALVHDPLYGVIFNIEYR